MEFRLLCIIVVLGCVNGQNCRRRLAARTIELNSVREELTMCQERVAELEDGTSGAEAVIIRAQEQPGVGIPGPKMTLRTGVTTGGGGNNQPTIIRAGSSSLPKLDEDEKALVEEIRGSLGAAFGSGTRDIVTEVKETRQERQEVQSSCGISCSAGACTCPAGYERVGGSGQTLVCRDTDECRSPSSCGSNEICFNTNGGYKCEPRTCDAGYTPLMQGRILSCTKDVPCRGTLDCIHTTNYVFFALPAKLVQLPFTLFESSASGTQGRQDSVNELTVECIKCDQVSRKARASDFSATLTDKRGIAGKVTIVNQLEGPQELLLTLNSKLLFGPTTGFVFQTKIKVVVGACEF